MEYATCEQYVLSELELVKNLLSEISDCIQDDQMPDVAKIIQIKKILKILKTL